MTNASEALQVPLMQVNSKTPLLRSVKVKHLPGDEFLELPKGHPSAVFQQELLNRGQLEPITIVDLGGKFHVEDGRKRIAAFRILAEKFPEDPRWTRILAIIRKENEEDRYISILASAAHNHQRHDNALTDLTAIEEILKVHGQASDKALANMLGMNIGTLRRRRKLLKLSDDFLDELRDGNIAVSTGERIAKQSQEVQAKLWTIYLEKGSISSQDVTDAQRVRRDEEIEKHKDVLFPGLAEYAMGTSEDAPICTVPEHAGIVLGWTLVDQMNRCVTPVIGEEDKEEVFAEASKGVPGDIILTPAIVIVPPDL